MEHVLKFLTDIGLNELFPTVWKRSVMSKEKPLDENPRTYRNCLYAINDSKEGMITIQRYDRSRNTWEITSALNKRLARFSVISNRNELFIFGGYENGSEANKVI